MSLHDDLGVLPAGRPTAATDISKSRLVARFEPPKQTVKAFPVTFAARAYLCLCKQCGQPSSHRVQAKDWHRCQGRLPARAQTEATGHQLFDCISNAWIQRSMQQEPTRLVKSLACPAQLTTCTRSARPNSNNNLRPKPKKVRGDVSSIQSGRCEGVLCCSDAMGKQAPPVCDNHCRSSGNLWLPSVNCNCHNGSHFASDEPVSSLKIDFRGCKLP